MKKIKFTIIAIFSFVFNITNAQDSLVLYSRVNGNKIIKMEITIGNDHVAHIKRSDGMQDCLSLNNPTILFNATELLCSYDDLGICHYKFLNKGYWLVPFIDQPVYTLINDCQLVCTCRSCDGEPISGNCSTRTSGRTTQCAQESCTGWCDGKMICFGTIGGAEISIEGGGVILKADSVIVE